MRSRRFALRFAVLALSVLLAACASTGKRTNELERLQYAYSAAIRWNDFEGAWNLVDPAYRQAHPMTDLEFERYRQVSISGYTVLASQTLPDGRAVREVDIGVTNRHTMANRNVRYTEEWAFDQGCQCWWLAAGLPDLWRGR